jgi:ABC-type Fe3+-siderophore transport system permease subunit
VIAIVAGLLIDHRSFDGLLLGEEEAHAIGIDVRRIRIRAIFFTSFLVAISVSVNACVSNQ